MPVGGYGGHVQAYDDKNVNKYYNAVNTEIGNGATALHVAVENDHFETAKMLLENGAKQTNSMEGATPLITAV